VQSFAAIVGIPEWEYREKSYSSPPMIFKESAPFVSFGWATSEFVDTDQSIKHKHILGTSQTGRDTLYNLLKGCKPAVVIGTLPLLFSIPIAMTMGIFAGFYGGRIDDLVVYCYSTLASIPGLLLLLAIIAALGKGMPQIAFGLGVTGWVGLCRLTRGETMKLRELEYIQAARCLGVPGWKIILRHVAPNLIHLVIITAILAFTGLVLSESVLAYLGVGLDNSWGSMIEFSRDEISRQPVIWWNLIVASLALFGLVLSVNVLGDAVRDVLDPRVTDTR
jgi:peptide/nickel transport system permease protein